MIRINRKRARFVQRDIRVIRFAEIRQIGFENGLHLMEERAADQGRFFSRTFFSFFFLRFRELFVVGRDLQPRRRLQLLQNLKRIRGPRGFLQKRGLLPLLPLGLPLPRRNLQIQIELLRAPARRRLIQNILLSRLPGLISKCTNPFACISLNTRPTSSKTL